MFTNPKASSLAERMDKNQLFKLYDRALTIVMVFAFLGGFLCSQVLHLRNH